MTILPTTQQLAEWLEAPKGTVMDTPLKVSQAFEHVAAMAAIHSAKACLQAGTPDAIQALINEVEA